MAKAYHNCFNDKCDTPLLGNFIFINSGGLQVWDDDDDDEESIDNRIEGFMLVGTHSNNDGPFGSVDLAEVMQYNHTSQQESYFCSKQCLFDWFQSELKDLPEPGTEEYRHET